jgi:hypothetical protein
MMSGRALFTAFNKYFPPYNRQISGNEFQAVVYLDAALLTKNTPASRGDWLRQCQELLSSLSRELDDLLPDLSDVRGYCSGLVLLFDRLGPDQSSDILKGHINETGISNMLKGRMNHRGLLGGSRDVREKPSYWRKYIQQTVAKFPK